MRKAFDVGPTNNRFWSWDLAAFRGDFSSRVRPRQKHFRLLIYASDNKVTDLHTSDEALSIGSLSKDDGNSNDDARKQ